MRRAAGLVAAVLAAALVVAGCGGGGSSGSGGEPASLAPEKAPVYLEVDLGAEGKQSEEFDQLTQNVFGIDNVGDFVAEQLEKQALGSGQHFNFEEEVEPWLGEKAGMYLAGYDGHDFHGYGVIFGTTNAGEAEEFVAKRVKENEEETEKGEFEGVKYYVENGGDTTLGVIGEYLVFAESKADFEAMVKAEGSGESLSGSTTYKKAMEAATAQGLGSVYVDIGGLIEEAGGSLDGETEAGLALLGIEPKQATAVATVVPHSEEVEVDLTSDVTRPLPNGDASALLESLPATAVLGFASPEFGKTFGEGLHEFSENGVPGQLEPGELEAAFGQLGIKVETLAKTIGDVAGFVEGSSEASLGGALVVETTNATEAKNTVANLGLLLRATQTPGVTVLSGELSGFSVRSSSFGSQPLIVGASGEKIVIAYGPRAAAQALRSNAKTLGATADFEAAKSVLGSTPMTAFVAGGPALRLVEALLSPAERAKFAAARPYVQKVRYAAVGSEAKGHVTTAKVILGLQK
ncbi:MAG: DUF3352 domain-containing protein [Actinobacteria bacterium]|nr:DUF3352 domain-containing protein [Actinomycetota bacterium]